MLGPSQLIPLLAKLLLAASQMTALNKPTENEHASVRNWMALDQPLVAPDNRFILEKEDIVTLRPGREYAWLDAIIENGLRKQPFLWLAVRPTDSPSPFHRSVSPSA
jgi:hypothetical protein